MTTNRILNWQGCNNVRDLGGLTASNETKTLWGAVVRSDTPSRLTADGWSALYAYGVRTVISLRTYGMEDKKHPVIVPSQTNIKVVSVDIEDVTDKVFREKWGSSDLWSTPMYFNDALKLWPRRHANALKEIAQAQPGGVLFHCVRGVDRTGIITLLLLALVGAPNEDILSDYALSIDPEREKLLAGEGTTTREVIFSTLAKLDAESYLLQGGMTQTDISTLRTRLLTNK